MRLLFSATPALGHLLPLLPLARAALARGHQVAVLTSVGMADTVARELPGADHLPAGTMPPEFAAEAARRTGKDVMRPTPDVIGEIFGGVRLETAFDEASRATTAWRPDIVVAEAFDTVGPAIAAAVGVRWYQAALGPAMPDPITSAITDTAGRWYKAHDLIPVTPSAYLDPCPPMMQAPGWHSDLHHVPVRPQPHSTPGSSWHPPATAPQQPRVLVTLGTVFSDRAVLAEVVRAVASVGASVIATVGMALQESPEPALQATVTGDNVHMVEFVPIAQLLTGIDLVVSAGGIGTVLAAMSQGLPMVLWPQGADQPINAARAEQAGVAAVVDSAAALADAVTAALRDDNLRTAAAAAARQIAAMPTATEALLEIEQHFN